MILSDMYSLLLIGNTCKPTNVTPYDKLHSEELGYNFSLLIHMEYLMNRYF